MTTTISGYSDLSGFMHAFVLLFTHMRKAIESHQFSCDGEKLKLVAGLQPQVKCHDRQNAVFDFKGYDWKELTYLRDSSDD